jgi:hypothetical protein
MMVTDSKVAIGDPMSSVPDPNLPIKPLKNRLPSVTEYPRLTNNTDLIELHKPQKMFYGKKNKI